MAIIQQQNPAHLALINMLREQGTYDDAGIERLFSDDNPDARSGESPRERQQALYGSDSLLLNDAYGDNAQNFQPNPYSEMEAGGGGGSIGPNMPGPPAPNVSLREPAPEPQAGAPAGSPGFAPRKPPQPSPMAGSTMTAPGSVPGGIIPFKPMGSTMGSSMASPASKGLYGAAGGLKGGGLGVPLDPVSDAASSPIDLLMEMFTSQRRKP